MLNRWQGIAAAAACATLVGFTACGGRKEKSDSATAAASSGEVARSDSAASATAPGGAAATAPSTTPTSTAGATGSMSITGGDPEILQVLAVVDQSEIQDGQLAQRQARNAQVKQFARTLVNEHTKSLQQDRQVAKSANIDLSGVMMSGAGKTAGTSGATKSASDTSQSASKTGASQPSGPTGATGVTAQLINAHTQTMEQVRQQQGAAFDSAFVDAQVKGHQEVLTLLQSAQAQDAALQKHVAAAIKDVQSHLEKGQQLQQSLSSGATGAASDTTSKSKSKPKPGADTGRRG
jgi:putative membrane protein